MALNNSHIIGDMSGDITVTAGSVAVEAGLYSLAFAQVGHGGLRVRGEHSGDLTVTSTIGGITATGAPNLGSAGNPLNFADGTWNNNRDNSSVQFGHGGFDSDHRLALPARTIAVLQPDGTTVNGVTSNPGDGININPDTGLAYGHNGNITLDAARGVRFTATGNSAFAQVGHGGISTSGDHRGDISIVARNGDVVFDRIAIQVDDRGVDRRAVGTQAHVMAGHGGRLSNGGHTGNISVTASGNVAFHAGRDDSFAQLGHGGLDDVGAVTIGVQGALKGPEQAAGTHSGDITVNAGGDVIFRSGFGFGNLAFSQLGHGGYRNYADILEDGGTGSLVGGGASAADQQGHNGVITVNSGGDIRFDAGQVEGEILPGQEPFGIERNIQVSPTILGHGGYESFGDHWGDININAAGDLRMAARGGWDTVTIEGADNGPLNPATAAANARGTPRYGSNEDNGTDGLLNFALLGHGGLDAEHRAQSVIVPNAATATVPAGTLIPVVGLAANDTFTTTVAHGLSVGDEIAFQNNAGGGGVANNTRYFVLASGLTATQFQVSTTPGGAVLNITSNLQRQTQSNSGKFGDGMGTAGSSDITIDVGGDVIVEAAQAATVGPAPRIQVVQDAFVANTATPAVYRDLLGNIVALDARYSVVAPAASIVDRTAATGDQATDLLQLFDGPTPFDKSPVALTDGDVVRFLTIAGGTGLTAGTDYFVVNATPTNFQLSATPGGAAINFTTNLTGTNLTVNGDGVGDRWFLPGTSPTDSVPEAVMAAQDGFAMIGHGGRSTDFSNGGVTSATANRGDTFGHSGNISITAGGKVEVKGTDIDVQVGTLQTATINVDNAKDGTIDYSFQVGPGVSFEDSIGGNGNAGAFQGQNQFSLLGRNFAQIGSGGWTSRGDHSGDISIVAGQDGLGDGLRVIAGEDAQSYAQIGNGGYDSDGYDPTGTINNDNARLDDSGSTGTVNITTVGDVLVHGGGFNDHVMGAPGTLTANVGDGDQIVILSDNASFSYAQIGHGGYANGGSQVGDITVQSTAGGITVQGGKSQRFNYAQIGNGGANVRAQAHGGNITVVAEQDVVVQGGKPIRDSEASQAEIDGVIAANTSHISHAVVNSAQIGNGGWDSDAQGGNLDLSATSVGGFTGNIEVISVNGNVRLLAGGDPTITNNADQFNRGNSAHIGNGGNATDGSHSGDIRVSAGLNVEVIGGAASSDNMSQIGHGGYENNGNLSGNIEVIAGQDLIMNRGADTDISTAPPVLDPPNASGYWAVRQSTNANGQSTFALSRYDSVFDNTLRFQVTGTAATDTFTVAFEHGLADGEPVMFGGVFPAGQGTGLTTDTLYYVDELSPTTFALYTDPGLTTQAVFSTNLNLPNIATWGLQRITTATGSGATDTITMTAHGLQVGDRIRFPILDEAGTGIATGTTYFVRNVTTDTFQLSTTNGGAPIDITADFSGDDDFAMRNGAGTVFRTARTGSEIFNNWAKIGHGDHLLRQRNSGAGLRNGDIDVSVGRHVIMSDPTLRPFGTNDAALNNPAYTRAVGTRDQTLIGHIDPINGASNAFRSTSGHTYVASSRTNPFDTGTGEMRLFADAMLTSAGAGFFDELRLYIPTPAQNLIQEGVSINGTDYTRIPTPDGTRADELPGTDHTQTRVGTTYGEVDGTFIPEGPYTPNIGFGLYNVYYGGIAPVVPPVPGGGGGGGGGPVILPPVIVEAPLPVPVIPPFDFSPFIFNDKFDSFDRDGYNLEGEFLYSLFSLFGLDANALYFCYLHDEIRVEGDEILEESPGLFGLGPARTEEERKEEEDKSGRYLNYRNIMHGQYWTFNYSTGEYSSYRVFGCPNIDPYP